MYSLFSDRARKVMQLTSQEAHRLNHEYIGTEHILLGLLKEGSGVTPSMLKKIDRDFGKIRAELSRYLKKDANDAMVAKLRRTPEADRVLEYAEEEARTSGHKRVLAEHILLGLLRSPQEIAGMVLRGFGIAAEEVREEIDDWD